MLSRFSDFWVGLPHNAANLADFVEEERALMGERDLALHILDRIRGLGHAAPPIAPGISYGINS